MNAWYIDYKGNRIEVDLATGERLPPATPQPSAPVVACKAPTWCGHRLPDALMRGYEMGTVRTTEGTSIVHCSPACRDAKHPPLAAKPAEAKKCLDACDDCSVCKPAEQPKPAAKADCLFFGKSRIHGGAIHKRHWKNMFGVVMSTTVCDYHYLHEIEPKGGGSDVLHNDKVPERLPRPRLAHSMGIEDPTLPEAR
jgi:hypothetical protein